MLHRNCDIINMLLKPRRFGLISYAVIDNKYPPFSLSPLPSQCSGPLSLAFIHSSGSPLASVSRLLSPLPSSLPTTTSWSPHSSERAHPIHDFRNDQVPCLWQYSSSHFHQLICVQFHFSSGPWIYSSPVCNHNNPNR